jgi:sugar phosphate permease
MSFILYLDRYCFSFAERFIKQDLQLSDDEIGLLLSSFFLAYAVAQVPSGWLSDRFGPRVMLTLYMVLWSLFTGLMGLAFTFGMVLVLRLGCGMAQAGAYPTSGNLLSKWVPFSARGQASSLIALGGRLGGALAPVFTAYLMVAFMALDLETLVGPEYGAVWRPVMLVYGAISLLVAAAFWAYFRDRPRDHPSCNAEEIDLIERGRPAGATSPHGRVGGLPWRYLLQSRSLWLSSVSQFGTNFGWVFLLTWLPRYLTEVHDVPVVQRGWMAGLPLFVGLVGMLSGGWLTDRLTRRLGQRWGRGLPMSLSRFVAMASFLVCLGLRSPWAVTAALAVVALATDLGTPSVWAFVQDVGGRHVGSVLGWGNMWGNLGAMLSPVVLNRVIAHWGWNALFVACAGAFLLSGVTALGVDATIPITPADEE